jgi:asparagine synthase (glutamine-hydrolysing)
MCGIAGIVNIPSNVVSVNTILNRLKHRGPDDSGIYVKKNVTFLHTRLSIQDLSENAHQPMHAADGRYTIVFNGEIYNHWQIRQKLTNCGVVFKSTSDTETLLHAYITYGPKCLEMLNGIFAFAIYDEASETIFIARDNFGVKPLYYYCDNKCFAFASELKAIMNLPGLDYSFAPEVLYNYLLFLWSPGENLPFKNIRKLNPGHYITIQAKPFASQVPVQYYKVPFSGDYEKHNERDWIDMLDSELTNAVNRQLLSDVPVGFFLSGGLDSSLIAAIAKKRFPDSQMKAYTIDTGDINTEGFAKDLPYAKKVARHLNIDLEVIKADIDIVNDFDKMIWHLDEPIGDATPLNVFNIATRAYQQGYKVLLGGTAGDDVFSGYRRHRALNMEKYIDILPYFLKKGIKFTSDVLPMTTRTRRIKKLFNNIDTTSLERRISYFFWIPPSTALALFKSEMRDSIDTDGPHKYFGALTNEIDKESNLLNQMLFWELRSFLPDHNLNYNDKMGMAASVEVRVPFLDKDLVALSTKMPPNLKVKGHETKYILKKLAERYLPKEVIYRSKTGFLTPIRKWVKHDLKDVINERLLSDDLDHWNIFERRNIENIIHSNANGKEDNAYTIWTLLAIESWLRQFVK